MLVEVKEAETEVVETEEVETEEVEEQEQDEDTTKTISPVSFHCDSLLRPSFLTSMQPPEATARFSSTVKATLLRLGARLGDLQAIAQNQASTSSQPSSR